MVVVFFGHANFIGSPSIEEKIHSYLKEIIRQEYAEFYFGGYGGFDTFAFSCVKKFQQVNQKVKTFFITPYITESYQRNHLLELSKQYDGVLYPPLEHVPYKWAISRRNQWMIEQADIVITYMRHKYGGAWQAYRSAQKRKRSFIPIEYIFRIAKKEQKARFLLLFDYINSGRSWRPSRAAEKASES